MSAIFHRMLQCIKSKWHKCLLDDAAETRKQTTSLISLIHSSRTAGFASALVAAAAATGYRADRGLVWCNIKCLRHFAVVGVVYILCIYTIYHRK